MRVAGNGEINLKISHSACWFNRGKPLEYGELKTKGGTLNLTRNEEGNAIGKDISPYLSVVHA